MVVVNGIPRNVSPPTSPEEERRCKCNDEAMKAIFYGLTGDVPTQVDKCKSAKILWNRLKKLYRNELDTTESTCESENNNAIDTCADDRASLECCSSLGDVETHLFMAHETDIEDHTSKRGNAKTSHQYDVFDSDTDKEEEDAKVDLKCEPVSALEELLNVRNNFKNYKRLVHEDCSQMRTCFEVSTQEVGLFSTQLKETKGLTDELKSVLDSKGSEIENLRNEYKLFKNVAVVEKNRLIKCLEEYERCVSELKTQQKDTKECRCKDPKVELETKDKEHQQIIVEMELLRKELEKCQDELKLRMKNSTTWRNNVDLKGKGKMREDSVTGSMNRRRPPTGRTHRYVAATKSRQAW